MASIRVLAQGCWLLSRWVLSNEGFGETVPPGPRLCDFLGQHITIRQRQAGPRAVHCLLISSAAWEGAQGQGPRLRLLEPGVWIQPQPHQGAGPGSGFDPELGSGSGAQGTQVLTWHSSLPGKHEEKQHEGGIVSKNFTKKIQ